MPVKRFSTRGAARILELFETRTPDDERADAIVPPTVPDPDADPTLPLEVAFQDPTAEQWYALACELEGTSPLEAQHAYHKALAIDPDMAEAHVDLGRHYHSAGELGKAEAHYRDAVRLAPGDAIAHFNLGVLLEDRGRPDEAVHAYEQAISRDAEQADAHHNLGLLLEARGRRPEAMRHLMEARRLYAEASGDR
jgi:tetratricopeptide (TPR) repeat protein